MPFHLKFGMSFPVLLPCFVSKGVKPWTRDLGAELVRGTCWRRVPGSYLLFVCIFALDCLQ